VGEWKFVVFSSKREFLVAFVRTKSDWEVDPEKGKRRHLRTFN